MTNKKRIPNNRNLDRLALCPGSHAAAWDLYDTPPDLNVREAFYWAGIRMLEGHGYGENIDEGVELWRQLPRLFCLTPAQMTLAAGLILELQRTLRGIGVGPGSMLELVPDFSVHLSHNGRRVLVGIVDAAMLPALGGDWHLFLLELSEYSGVIAERLRLHRKGAVAMFADYMGARSIVLHCLAVHDGTTSHSIECFEGFSIRQARAEVLELALAAGSDSGKRRPQVEACQRCPAFCRPDRCPETACLYVVQLEPGVWLSEEMDGDPGRTLVVCNASKYRTKPQAEAALERALGQRHFRAPVIVQTGAEGLTVSNREEETE